MVRRSLIPALVILLLLLGASNAQAAAYEITFEPELPDPGDRVTFHAKQATPGSGGPGDKFSWDFGDGASDVGRNPTHVYTEARTYTVVLTVTDAFEALVETISVKIAVGPNAPPSAAFSVAPASPLVGELVTFTGGSDPNGDSVTRLWNFGDGTVDTAAAPSHVYANAGDYTVVLSVIDARGASATTFQSVTVRDPATASAPSGGEPAPSTGAVGGSAPVFTAPPGATGPFPMRPFPVVRIAGTVLPRAALIRILSVRAPRGSRIVVRCVGRACPVGSMATTSSTRLVRLRRFERRLRAGIRLKLFVRQENRIGKYTSFLIRAGAPPKRVDLCLFPKRRSPGRCP